MGVFGQPYEPRVIWDRSGLQDSSSYGTQILPLGDQNDDGFADWAVTAWGNIGYHGTQRAYLEFFHGSDVLPQEPYMTLHPTSDEFWQVFEVGDVNGDGYKDWWIQGELFFGGLQADTMPDMTFAPSGGFLEGSIGDFNGDEFDDVYTYNFQTDALRIYYGGNPMDTLSDWVLHEPPQGLLQSYPYSIGDFTGDGASDFLCFNPNNGRVAVFLGGSDPDTVPDYEWTIPDRGPIGGVKSLNGDSMDEFLFKGTDIVDVYYGRPELQPMPDADVNFSCAFADQAISAGDFNQDGYNDLIMLTSSCANNIFGSLTLHLGHPWLYPEPTFVIDGWTDPLNLIGIYTAAGLGDVNGDGIDDIAIGSWDDFAFLGWRGRCVILAGDDTLIADAEDYPPVPQIFSVSIFPNPFNDEMTIRLDIPIGMDQVQLTTYNVQGQIVTSEQRTVSPGPNILHYSAHEFSSGLYFLHLESGVYQSTQKLMLLR